MITHDLTFHNIFFEHKKIFDIVIHIVANKLLEILIYSVQNSISKKIDILKIISIDYCSLIQRCFISLKKCFQKNFLKYGWLFLYKGNDNTIINHEKRTDIEKYIYNNILNDFWWNDIIFETLFNVHYVLLK